MNFLELQKANETIKTTDIKGKDYAQVNERIKVFRMLFPNGSITTEIISCIDGVVVMKASIFDGSELLATGHAYERESSSFINKTSYIENCETSAVGRALGMLGIGIDTSICSAEELQNAIKNQNTKPEQSDTEQTPEQLDAEATEQFAKEKISDVMAKALKARCEKEGVPEDLIYSLYHVKSLSDLTNLQYRNVNDYWDKILEKAKA